MRQGFNADQTRELAQEARDYKMTRERIDNNRKITGRSVMDANEAFLATDRAGIRRKQMANKAGQDFLLGEKNERIQMAMENAEQQLLAEKKIGGQENTTNEWVNDFFGIAPKLGFQSTRESMKAARAEDNLYREAIRKGVPADKAMELLGYHKLKPLLPGPQDEIWSDTGRTEAMRTEGFNKLALEVERRDGRPLDRGPDLAPKFDLLIQETRETNRLLQQRRDNLMPNGPGVFLPPGGVAGGNAPPGPARGAAQPKRP
jgi:hypothetical protein